MECTWYICYVRINVYVTKREVYSEDSGDTNYARVIDIPTVIMRSPMFNVANGIETSKKHHKVVRNYMFKHRGRIQIGPISMFL